MKKKIMTIAFMFALCMTGMVSFTSCTPDEMDAFAEGYRYGYNSVQDDDDYYKAAPVEENTNTENE